MSNYVLKNLLSHLEVACLLQCYYPVPTGPPPSASLAGEFLLPITTTAGQGDLPRSGRGGAPALPLLGGPLEPWAQSCPRAAALYLCPGPPLPARGWVIGKVLLL